MDQKATLNTGMEQEFKDLDRGWVAAYLQGTADLFDRVWADDFIFTSPFGQFTNKEREIADIKSGALSFESLSTGDIIVKVYGNTAVMAGSLTMKGRYKDRDISGQYSYTNILRSQQQECWRIVASHAAHISSNHLMY
jgi:ketosteroid isomerase-like protein